MTASYDVEPNPAPAKEAVPLGMKDVITVRDWMFDPGLLSTFCIYPQCPSPNVYTLVPKRPPFSWFPNLLCADPLVAGRKRHLPWQTKRKSTTHYVLQRTLQVLPTGTGGESK